MRLMKIIRSAKLFTNLLLHLSLYNKNILLNVYIHTHICLEYLYIMLVFLSLFYKNRNTITIYTLWTRHMYKTILLFTLKYALHYILFYEKANKNVFLFKPNYFCAIMPVSLIVKQI